MTNKAAKVLVCVLVGGCGSVTATSDLVVSDAGADVALEHAAAGGAAGSSGAAGGAAGSSGAAGATDAGLEAKSDGGYPPCSEAAQTPESQIDDCFPAGGNKRLRRDGFNCIRATTGEDLCLNLNRSVIGAPPVLVVKACAECASP